MGSWARWCRVFFFVLASIVALAGSVCDGFLLRRYPIRPTVVPKKKVENHAIIGAGSVVIRDISEGTTVFGNPARPLS